MRWLFLTLLLINGAYLGWIVYQEQPGGPASVSDKPRRADKGNLLLLSEHREPLPERDSYPGDSKAEVIEPVEHRAPDKALSAEPETQPETGATQVEAPVKTSCFRIEGIKKEKEALALMTALEVQGIKTRKTGSLQTEERRYWVKVSAGKTKAQASKVLKTLKKGGLRDFYLIQGNDVGKTISLGVFSTRDAAERRYKSVQGLKLKPKIDEIRLPIRRWWLDTAKALREPLDEVLRTQAIRDVSIESRRCQ